MRRSLIVLVLLVFAATFSSLFPSAASEEAEAPSTSLLGPAPPQYSICSDEYVLTHPNISFWAQRHIVRRCKPGLYWYAIGMVGFMCLSYILLCSLCFKSIWKRIRLAMTPIRVVPHEADIELV